MFFFALTCKQRIVFVLLTFAEKVKYALDVKIQPCAIAVQTLTSHLVEMISQG